MHTDEVRSAHEADATSLDMKHVDDVECQLKLNI